MKCMRCNNEMESTENQITIEDLLKDNNTISGTSRTINTYWGQQGWICPKCGRVYSPTTSMCFYCGNSNYTITTIGTNPTPSVLDPIKWSTSISSEETPEYTIKGEIK